MYKTTKGIFSLLTLTILSLLLFSGSAQAARADVAKCALREQAAGVKETRAGNPVYRNGKLTFYAVGSPRAGLPWSAAFASYCLKQAGYNPPNTIRSIKGAYLTGYIGSLRSWVTKNKAWANYQNPPTVGSLAFYGNSHVGIVTGVSASGRVTRVTQGNFRDRVSSSGPAGVTDYAL
jgi:hypothetical protein